MKKLMVLGATYTQIPLILTAKRLGYTTIVASTEGNYPALPYADVICTVDISKPEAVLKEARKHQIDGIATCCMDVGVRAVGFVCEKMGLCGLTEQSALLSNQKLLMKEAFEKGNVKSPRFQKVIDVHDLRQIWNAFAHPVILKAVDLQASRGIFLCNSYEELEKSFQMAMGMTKEDFCIVEEFITGKDIGAQAFVYNGEILFILPHNDEVFAGSANLPIGHSAPLLAPAEIIEEAKEQCQAAIRALGLNFCAVNIDMIQAADGQVYMIELTGRVGATCLPELVALYYGIDYYEMIVKMAMGEDPRPIFSGRAAHVTPNASRFFMAKESGVVAGIVNHNPPSEDIALLDMYIQPGDFVNEFKDGKDRFGQVVVTGPDLEACFRRLDEITDGIELQYSHALGNE